jgi:hypothetical protein
LTGNGAKSASWFTLTDSRVNAHVIEELWQDLESSWFNRKGNVGEMLTGDIDCVVGSPQMLSI